LFFFRVFQAAGASPGFSIGAGVIGDIYKLEERGTAIGIFLAVSFVLCFEDIRLVDNSNEQAVLLGTSLAPIAGGKMQSFFFRPFTNTEG
jgi:MFS family permease